MPELLKRADYQDLSARLSALRRSFHRYPESAWTEYRTTAVVIRELTDLGYEVLTGDAILARDLRMGLPTPAQDAESLERAIRELPEAEALIRSMAGGMTGAIGVLDTGRPGPTVALRFDIDCNDLEESHQPGHRPYDEDFISLHKNLSHGCGHDGHTAIGLGTARILMAYREHFDGKVLLCFQPAEEGARGGKAMAGSAVFDSVDYFISGHLGVHGGAPGVMYASASGFATSYKVDFEFRGVSAHAGASPETGRNAFAAGATAGLNLLALPRHSGGSTRVNVGVMQSGTGRNVIPDHAILKSEVRGSSTEICDIMFEKALKVCKGAALMHDCAFTHRLVGHSVDAPASPDLVYRIIDVAESVPGIVEVRPALDLAGSGGEDATFMMNRVLDQGGRACYMYLGADVIFPLHGSCYDFNEEALPLYATLFASIVLDILGG